MRYVAVFWYCLSMLTVIQATNFSDPEIQLSKGINQFGMDIYMELLKSNKSGNVLFSPLSIHSILSLTFMGASGETAKEMAKGLYLPSGEDEVKTGYQALLRDDSNSDNKHLQLANKVYVDNRIRVLDKFSKVAKKNFYSEFQNVNMKLPTTVDVVNKWVDNKTHHKISKIISKEDLTEHSRLLLVNALYFSGTWIHKFPKYSIRSAQFYTLDNDTVTVPMMEMEAWLNVWQNNVHGIDCLQLEYTSNSSMLIFLPRTTSLVELDVYIAFVSLKNVLKNLAPKRVAVSLPKFKLEQGPLYLKRTLQDLGMKRLFNDNAEFHNLSDGDLHVSQVIHKAVVDVHEDGTEAAAATAVLEAIPISAGIYKEPPIIFKADHPFVFLIYCSHTGSILFLGRFVNPRG